MRITIGNRLYGAVLVMSVVGCSLPKTVHAQQPMDQTTRALVELRDAFSHLSLRDSSAVMRTQLDSINDLIQLLEGRLGLASSMGARPLDATYTTALSFNAELLRAAAFASPDSASAIVSDVVSDLLWKSEDFEAGVGWSNPPTATGVEITVRVQRNGSDASGYYARANPRRYPDARRPLVIFTNEAPQTRKIPAGNYVMWIEDVAGAVIQKREVTVSALEDPTIIFVVQ